MPSEVPEIKLPALDPRWLSTPAESDAAFLPAFIRISVAIQTTLRDLIPREYFRNVARFSDPKTATPVLVYQATPPFRGKKRSELTYDVLHPGLVAALFRRTKPALIDLLASVELRLRAEGFPDLARLYSPLRVATILHDIQRLSKSRRYFALLIRAEGVLFDALAGLNGLGDRSLRAQNQAWTTFAKRWTYQLRRLYPGCDFSNLSPPLLEAAAVALQSNTDPLDRGGSCSTSGNEEMLQPIDSELPEVG